MRTGLSCPSAPCAIPWTTTSGSDQTREFSNERETTGISLPYREAVYDVVCLKWLLDVAQSCHCFAGGPLLYEGIRLTMNSRVLNGSQRVVMDGVISDDECRELQRLTNVRETRRPHLLPKGPVPLT